jgi:hypothetical protein
VYKTDVKPHWSADGSHFWYRNDLRGGAREFILVDAARGQRRRAFDHDRLAAALSKATGKKYEGDRLPFDAIELRPDAVLFRLDSTAWEVALASYECRPAAGPPGPPAPPPAPPAGPAADRREESPWVPGDSDPRAEAEAADEEEGAPGGRRSAVAPDGQWTAFVKDHNLYVRSAKGKEVQLTHDGKS